MQYGIYNQIIGKLYLWYGQYLVYLSQDRFLGSSKRLSLWTNLVAKGLRPFSSLLTWWLRIGRLDCMLLSGRVRQKLTHKRKERPPRRFLSRNLNYFFVLKWRNLYFSLEQHNIHTVLWVSARIIYIFTIFYPYRCKQQYFIFYELWYPSKWLCIEYCNNLELSYCNIGFL